MRSCFLDTCAVIDCLKDFKPAIQAVAAYENALISHVVFGELVFGCHRARNPAREIGRLLDWLREVTVTPGTESTAEVYGMLAAALERDGIRIPQNDLWIAALCVAFGLPLVTRDAHFSRVPGLNVIGYTL